jgi:hypothetical protein
MSVFSKSILVKMNQVSDYIVCYIILKHRDVFLNILNVTSMNISHKEINIFRMKCKTKHKFMNLLIKCN